MPKEVTIKSIAKELNITPSTVSRALSNHRYISEETKRLVNEVATKLNYRANKVASSLRSGKTHTIGVIIPTAKINFFGNVMHGIESLANLHGFNVLIYHTNETHAQEVKGIEAFLAARVDGILVSISKGTMDFSHFKEVQKSGVPIVFFDRANYDLGISSVVTDDCLGAFLATEHLIKQGYKNIAHASGPMHIKLFVDRLSGYKDALRAYNMKVRKDLIYSGNASIEAGREAMRHLLAGKVRPDAVFADDFTALGVVKEIKEHKLRMPEDIGVIGFGNELFGEHISPTLSTIDQQTILMGKESFRVLLQLIEQKNKTSSVAAAKKIVLKPIMIYRESSLKNKTD